MKLCVSCKINKPLSHFSKDKSKIDGYNSTCKRCRSLINKNYRQAHRFSLLEKEQNIRNRDKDIIRNRAHQFKLNNPELVKQRDKDTRIKHRDRVQQYEQMRRIRDKEKIASYRRAYFQKNKGTLLKKVKERIEQNPVFKMQLALRVRLRRALKGRYKSGSAVRDLGCTIDQLRDWIERQWETGMTWDNYGNKENQWSIDHEYPLSLVDISKRELVLPLVHYTNLQPMWHTQNMSKNNNLI